LSNLETYKEWPWKHFSVLFFFLIMIVIIWIYFFFHSELLQCPEFEYPFDVRDIVILQGPVDDIQFSKCPCYLLNQDHYLFIYRPIVQPARSSRGLIGGLAGLLLCLLCLATMGLLGLFAAFIAVTAYLGKIFYTKYSNEIFSWILSWIFFRRCLSSIERCG
jgi:hypothetical protein